MIVTKAKAILCTLMLSLGAISITGCNKAASTGEQSIRLQSGEEVSIQYINREELKDIITSVSEPYILLDVRKAEDYEASHLIPSLSADMDAAKDGDIESGTDNLKKALLEATGSETGIEGCKYVMLCYSGNSYAKKATELLISMGIDKESIYTLKGGYKEWTENDTDGVYQDLIVKADSE